ncbi:hypothetical protein VTI74DRAFT_4285 [Chaetomium olivicolor]
MQESPAALPCRIGHLLPDTDGGLRLPPLDTCSIAPSTLALCRWCPPGESALWTDFLGRGKASEWTPALQAFPPSLHLTSKSGWRPRAPFPGTPHHSSPAFSLIQNPPLSIRPSSTTRAKRVQFEGKTTAFPCNFIFQSSHFFSFPSNLISRCRFFFSKNLLLFTLPLQSPS